MKLLTLLFLLFIPATSFSVHVNQENFKNRNSLHFIEEGENAEMKGGIIANMQKVADWQIKNFSYRKEGNLHDYGIDAWTNGVLYLGMSRLASITESDTIYYNWLKSIGDENKWQIPANFKDYPRYQMFHADELCIAQFYLEMYEKYRESYMIAATEERLDWIMETAKNNSMNYKNKQVWSWCDALFMAPPVYVHMANIKHEDKYLEYMDLNFRMTYNHLYDIEEGLFFRDDSYFDKREANGEKVFWGRGNAWVVAGLTNILKLMPVDSPQRPFYEGLFKKLTLKLQRFQDSNGFWHASLLDPKSFPAPETSATAMIVYAMCYGINSGLLDAEQFRVSTIKGWNALNSVVDDSGKLGFIQPIGADPQKITADMTAVYGVGAYLMAGTEIYKLMK